MGCAPKSLCGLCNQVLILTEFGDSAEIKGMILEALSFECQLDDFFPLATHDLPPDASLRGRIHFDGRGFRPNYTEKTQKRVRESNQPILCHTCNRHYHQFGVELVFTSGGRASDLRFQRAFAVRPSCFCIFSASPCPLRVATRRLP